MKNCFTEEYFAFADLFVLDGEILSITQFGQGHINKTFLVATTRKNYILQEVNTRVFHNFDGLMHNIYAVTNMLRERGKETFVFVPTKEGEPYFKGERCFRMREFIDDTVVYQKAVTPKVFLNAGKAFGEFQNLLADFDASILVETIPHFHDTPKRFADFCIALKEDKCKRAKSCKEEIEFILDRKDTFSYIVEAIEAGSVPLRVTHNDTKLSNILMDEKTHEARAVIDLDTIMPGSMLYDFGDAIRFGASTAREDEPDLSKVHLSLELFEAFAQGFVGAVKDSITPKEGELLPYSAYLMTMECGMRFLTDYLNGDIYFATQYPEHNLVRARTQFRLASEMEQNEEKMKEIIAKILN